MRPRIVLAGTQTSRAADMLLRSTRRKARLDPAFVSPLRGTAADGYDRVSAILEHTFFRVELPVTGGVQPVYFPGVRR